MFIFNCCTSAPKEIEQERVGKKNRTLEEIKESSSLENRVAPISTPPRKAPPIPVNYPKLIPGSPELAKAKKAMPPPPKAKSKDLSQPKKTMLLPHETRPNPVAKPPKELDPKENSKSEKTSNESPPILPEGKSKSTERESKKNNIPPPPLRSSPPISYFTSKGQVDAVANAITLENMAELTKGIKIPKDRMALIRNPNLKNEYREPLEELLPVRPSHPPKASHPPILSAREEMGGVESKAKSERNSNNGNRVVNSQESNQISGAIKKKSLKINTPAIEKESRVENVEPLSNNSVELHSNNANAEEVISTPQEYYFKSERRISDIERYFRIADMVPMLSTLSGISRSLVGLSEIIYYLGKAIFHHIDGALFAKERRDDLLNNAQYEYFLAKDGLKNLSKGIANVALPILINIYYWIESYNNKQVNKNI